MANEVKKTDIEKALNLLDSIESKSGKTVKELDKKVWLTILAVVQKKQELPVMVAGKLVYALTNPDKKDIDWKSNKTRAQYQVCARRVESMVEKEKSIKIDSSTKPKKLVWVSSK